MMATKTATRLVLPSIGLLGLSYTLPRPAMHHCDSGNYSTFPANFSLFQPSTWALFRQPPPPPPPPPTAVKTTFNPVHYRQLSSGSFTGMFAGLAVAKLSRPLAIILGLLITMIEILALKGIHIIPYERLEKWIGGVNYKSMILDNMAYKIAFSAAFATAAAASW